jgi:hypothetical protein
LKSIKTTGLVALAVLMAMALIGVSSAMANWTQLCKKDENVCEKENWVKHIHKVGNAKLLFGLLGTVECDVLFLGEVLALGAPLTIHGNFTYAKCQRDGEACEVIQESEKALLFALKQGGELAKVTEQKHEVRVECGFLIKCTYGGENLEGHGLGALSTTSNGETRFEEQALHKKAGNFLCSAEVKLDHLSTPLESVYIAE